MKYLDLIICLQGNAAEIQYVMMYGGKSFTEYFNDFLLFQLYAKWYKSLNFIAR